MYVLHLPVPTTINLMSVLVYSKCLHFFLYYIRLIVGMEFPKTEDTQGFSSFFAKKFLIIDVGL